MTRGKGHLTIALTVMTNFGDVEWLQSRLTCLHQCIYTFHCVHHVDNIIKCELAFVKIDELVRLRCTCLPTRSSHIKNYKDHEELQMTSQTLNSNINWENILTWGAPQMHRAFGEDVGREHICMMHTQPYRERSTPSQSKQMTSNWSTLACRKAIGSCVEFVTICTGTCNIQGSPSPYILRLLHPSHSNVI